MRRRNNSGFLRFVCFLVALFCSAFAIGGIHTKKLNVTVGKNTNVVISQMSDPAVFWGIVIFMSLIALTLFYCAFFAKGEPKA